MATSKILAFSLFSKNEHGDSGNNRQKKDKKV